MIDVIQYFIGLWFCVFSFDVSDYPSDNVVMYICMGKVICKWLWMKK